MPHNLKNAPDLVVETWLNSSENLTLASLQGKVVIVTAFQMLCPGCVEFLIPQAKRIDAIFSKSDVCVIGLHTVFENHSAMPEESLKAFLKEYDVSFPVAIDRPSGSDRDPLPTTMRNYNMRGTPTLIMIDRQGRLRKQQFGHEQDMIVGAEIMSLLRETAPLSGT